MLGDKFIQPGPGFFYGKLYFLGTFDFINLIYYLCLGGKATVPHTGSTGILPVRCHSQYFAYSYVFKDGGTGVPACAPRRSIIGGHPAFTF